jgi:hypothetical protein
VGEFSNILDHKLGKSKVVTGKDKKENDQSIIVQLKQS